MCDVKTNQARGSHGRLLRFKLRQEHASGSTPSFREEAQPGCAFTSPWLWEQCHCAAISSLTAAASFLLTMIPPGLSGGFSLLLFVSVLLRATFHDLCIQASHTKSIGNEHQCEWKINPSKLHISLLFNGTNGWPCFCNFVLLLWLMWFKTGDLVSDRPEFKCWLRCFISVWPQTDCWPLWASIYSSTKWGYWHQQLKNN